MLIRTLEAVVAAVVAALLAAFAVELWKGPGAIPGRDSQPPGSLPGEVQEPTSLDVDERPHVGTSRGPSRERRVVADRENRLALRFQARMGWRHSQLVCLRRGAG